MRRVLFFLWVVATASALGACRGSSAPPGPQAQCQAACEEHVRGCSEHECARGCGFILDRLVEHEGPTVLACVASRVRGQDVRSGDGRAGACGDPLWAECATRVGVHADGGPPAPATVEE